MTSYRIPLLLGGFFFLTGCGGGGNGRPPVTPEDPIGPVPQVEMHVRGTVLDLDTGAPVQGATVRLADVSGCVPLRTTAAARVLPGTPPPPLAARIGPICPPSYPVSSDGTYELTGSIPDPDGTRTCALGRRLTAEAPGYQSVAVGYPELQCTDDLQTIDFVLERSELLLGV